MKIAVTGKGGVGKTTLSGLLAKLFQRKGYRVFAIDADPDANLAATLGFPDPAEITPLVEMKELIKERMGLDDLETIGSFFQINPKVDDVPDRFSVEHEGIRLMTMGEIRKGGMGCACPENTFVRQLISHLLMQDKDVVILDMEAGIEHLGRGTARAVDRLVVVVEPGLRSIETARKIRQLAGDLELRTISAVGNKVRRDQDEKFIRKQLRDWPILGMIPYSEDIAASGRGETGLDLDRIVGWEETLAGIVPEP